MTRPRDKKCHKCGQPSYGYLCKPCAGKDKAKQPSHTKKTRQKTTKK